MEGLSAENRSISQFVLLGLVELHNLQIILFILFLVVYTMTIIGNILIITIIRLESNLHKPMYFFLANLSFIEILYTSTVTPNTLNNFLHRDRTISFTGCFTQLFFFVALGGSECLLLSAMAYDRYTAICQPLLYSARMNPSLSSQLAAFSWCTGILNSLIQTSFAASLPFCEGNKINHFFCDLPPILQLSCGYNKLGELLTLLVGECIIAGGLAVTVFSYICIIRTVLNMSHNQTKVKTFSTCGSHLTVVTLFFGTVLFPFLHPSSASSAEQDKALAVIYAVMTPLINPFIYSIRNTDFKKAISKLMVQQKVHGKN